MKVLVQWSLANPTDWVEIDLTPTGRDARAWRDLPRKPIPSASSVVDNAPGWIYDVAIQGVLLGGHDHYAAEPIAGGGIVVTVWDDDPEDWPVGTRHAWVWTFRPGTVDRTAQSASGSVRHQGPDQSLTIYAEESYRARLSAEMECGGQLVQFRSWGAFVAPAAAVTLHGIWLSDALDAEHVARRRRVNWREWL